MQDSGLFLSLAEIAGVLGEGCPYGWTVENCEIEFYSGAQIKQRRAR